MHKTYITYATDIPLDDDAIETKVEQAWWSPDIPRAQLKALMKGSNRYGLLDFGLWLVLLIVSGYLAWLQGLLAASQRIGRPASGDRL